MQNCCGTTVALTMWNHFPNLLENVEPFSLKYRDWFQFVEPFSQFILNSMENQVEPIWFHILSISCSIAILWNQNGSTIFPAQKVILHYRELLYSVVSLSGYGKWFHKWNHGGSTSGTMVVPLGFP